mgnify:CR=1 FL=1
MFKKLLLLSVIFITQLYFNPLFAHVLHYQKLNKLEFDLFRNNQLIGQHIYVFNRNGRNLTVHSKINFEIKKLGIVLYKYKADGTEEYFDGEFLKFSSITHQNKKEKLWVILLKQLSKKLLAVKEIERQKK